MRFQIFLAILLVFFGVILITAAFFVPNNPRHGLYQAGIQQAAFLHPPRYGLCCKVRHSGKRGGGDKRERSSEDCATAQVLQIIPHLHLRLHLSSTRALFLDKKQIKAIGCQVSKLSNSFCYNFGKGSKPTLFLIVHKYDYQNQGKAIYMSTLKMKSLSIS